MRARTIVIAASLMGLSVLLSFMDRDGRISASEQAQAPQAMIGLVGNMVFLVHRVEPGSPAERAGLQPGDLIKSINGRRVESIEDLRWITQSSPGRPIEIVYLRYNPATSQYEGYHATLVSAPWKAPGP